MPISTSSSSDRAPPGRWLVIWVVAFVLTAVTLGSVEWFWRDHGMRPSITDTLDNWSIQRHRLERSDTRRQIVLLGASRMQLDISHEMIARRLPTHELINLAVDGKCAPAVLADLALRADYRGVVLVSVIEHCLEDSHFADQQFLVDYYYRSSTAFRRFDTSLNNWFNSRLAATNGELNIYRLLTRSLQGNTLPAPNYLVTLPDRARTADYRLINIAAHRRGRIARASTALDAKSMTSAAWLAKAAHLETWARIIQARGGQVVFLRLPSADEHWQIDAAKYPRVDYWDLWQQVSAATMLHFQDLPNITSFHLPDTSHLDQRDAPAFTDLVVSELADRCVLNDD